MKALFMCTLAVAYLIVTSSLNHRSVPLFSLGNYWYNADDYLKSSLKEINPDIFFNEVKFMKLKNNFVSFIIWLHFILYEIEKFGSEDTESQLAQHV